MQEGDNENSKGTPREEHPRGNQPPEAVTDNAGHRGRSRACGYAIVRRGTAAGSGAK